MLLLFREAVPPFLPSGPRGWPGQGEGWRPVVGVAHSLPSGAWAVLHPGVGVKVSERPLARALSPECHSPAGWGWRTAWTCLGMPQAGEGTAEWTGRSPGPEPLRGVPFKKLPRNTHVYRGSSAYKTCISQRRRYRKYGKGI